MASSLNIVNLLIQGFEQRDLVYFGGGVDNVRVLIYNFYRTFVKFPGLAKVVIRNLMIPNHE